MSGQSPVIERPEPGTVITGIERARISCRKKIEKPEKIRQTSAHHAFSYVAKDNVIIVIEKAYFRNRSN